MYCYTLFAMIYGGTFSYLTVFSGDGCGVVRCRVFPGVVMIQNGCNRCLWMSVPEWKKISHDKPPEFKQNPQGQWDHWKLPQYSGYPTISRRYTITTMNLLFWLSLIAAPFTRMYALKNNPEITYSRNTKNRDTECITECLSFGTMESWLSHPMIRTRLYWYEVACSIGVVKKIQYVCYGKKGDKVNWTSGGFFRKKSPTSWGWITCNRYKPFGLSWK